MLLVLAAGAFVAPVGVPGSPLTVTVARADGGAAAREEKERRIRVCVNRERAKRGLSQLTFDPSLARAARLQAKNMRIHRFFDHQDPFGRGPAERVAKFTLVFGVYVGENIAMGYPHSRAACAGWMASPGHRDNILHPDYTAIGTGYTGGERYWVQVFGFPAPPEQFPDEDYIGYE